MAIGPDGVHLSPPTAAEVEGLGEERIGFLRGLEGLVDRALERHPAGESFVYGIHQEMDPPMVDFLVRRYAAAGWGEALLKPGLTGAHLLVLVPARGGAEGG